MPHPRNTPQSNRVRENFKSDSVLTNKKLTKSDLILTTSKVRANIQIT
jgi:hypothetical protein